MNRSVQIALAIFALLALYMLSGLVRCGREVPEQSADAQNIGHPVITVLARDVETESIFRTIRITAKTLPSRGVELKAQTTGTIEEVMAKRGSVLSAGDEIAAIELKDRLERLEQAKATLSQAQFEFDAAERLEERDLRSASQVAQALSSLRGSEQMVRAMELDIEHTRIRASFDGILQDRYVELGDYLGIGDPVARVIDIDPIIVAGDVTEDQVGHLKPGQHGIATLSDGTVIEGYIRYVASEANQEARTFAVELEVANPELVIHAGVTASIIIETEEVRAVRVDKDFLATTDEGRIGIKVVDGDNRVRFIEADKQELGPDSIWITGLPEKIRLITRGQGYTLEGDLVEVVMEEPSR
jgi:multidrug efflux system membrane fusion protein